MKHENGPTSFRIILYFLLTVQYSTAVFSFHAILVNSASWGSQRRDGSTQLNIQMHKRPNSKNRDYFLVTIQSIVKALVNHSTTHSLISLPRNLKPVFGIHECTGCFEGSLHGLVEYTLGTNGRFNSTFNVPDFFVL